MLWISYVEITFRIAWTEWHPVRGCTSVTHRVITITYHHTIQSCSSWRKNNTLHDRWWGLCNKKLDKQLPQRIETQLQSLTNSLPNVFLLSNYHCISFTRINKYDEHNNSDRREHVFEKPYNHMRLSATDYMMAYSVKTDIYEIKYFSLIFLQYII